MAAKRTFAAWAAIVLLGFDIGAEVMRLGVCIGRPEQASAPLCADPIGPVSRMVAQMFRLLAAEGPPETPPVAPPPPPPPQVPAETQMDRVRNRPTL